MNTSFKTTAEYELKLFQPCKKMHNIVLHYTCTLVFAVFQKFDQCKNMTYQSNKWKGQIILVFGKAYDITILFHNSGVGTYQMVNVHEKRYMIND